MKYNWLYQKWKVSKRWLLAMGLICWLHGVTIGIVFEGQKGLLNRFLWTFVIGVFPFLILTQSRTWRRIAAAILYFEMATFVMVRIIEEFLCFSIHFSFLLRNPKNVMPLPDIGHDILPVWKDIHFFNPFMDTPLHFEANKVPDVIMALLMVMTTLFLSTHSAKWKIVQRFFIIYGTLCIMRSVTVIVTSLPDSAEKCRRMTPTGDLQSGASAWQNITIRSVMVKSLKLLVPVGEVTCGDMVFSGHSMLMVLCAMTWHTYYKWVPASINYVKVAIWVLTVFGLVSIIWVRMHYSLDVVLALYFTVTLWSSYHRIANDVKIGHRFSAVWIFDALIIYPSIEWLESVEYHQFSEKDVEDVKDADDTSKVKDSFTNSLSKSYRSSRVRKRQKKMVSSMVLQN